MTRDELNRAITSRQEAWAARDSTALAAFYTADATVSSPMFATVTGRVAIKEAFDALFRAFPDWEHVVEEPLVDGARIALPFSARATHLGDFMGLHGSGRHFEIQGVQLFDMRDGLIARERRIYDFTALLIQVGVLRGRPGH